MTSFGTPLTVGATKLMLLGSGELGKEVAIEAQRLGLEVIAVDRYPNAPAMQVAHRSHVLPMVDPTAIKAVVHLENPDFIVPEVEAIATDALVELEAEGFRVIPTARATKLTMNREGIRRLVAEDLGIKTSRYEFAGDNAQYQEAIHRIGFPCVVKPVMSSSGHGQTLVAGHRDAEAAWDFALSNARGSSSSVIVEEVIDFDFEITLLTVRHLDGTSFCEPIGHLQIDGDYRESWQPQLMSEWSLREAQRIAGVVTSALGGYGVFGVELFIKGDEVYFSEVSPRPHDTGMVTLISQDLSEFALHVRAILGLPVPSITQLGFAASCALVIQGQSEAVRFSGLEQALSVAGTSIRLFGKPNVAGHRRMGVALALGTSIEDARSKATAVAVAIEPSF